jgi:hypothetical protein
VSLRASERRNFERRLVLLRRITPLPRRNAVYFCSGAYSRLYPQRSCRDRHAIRRAFVPVFRAARDFPRASAAGFLVLAAAGFLVLAAAGFLVLATMVFLALPTASTGAGNSGLGGFGVRWWPWCSDSMRAASSSVRSSVSARFRRSSSRYSGIVLVAMAIVWQNYSRPSCPILPTR